MKFNSIKEYFYKLYNVCYFVTLIPLGVYIYLYLEMQSGALVSPIQDADQLLIIQIAFIIFIVLTLTSVHWLVRKKLSSILGVVSLGDRMDGYYTIAIFRIGMGVAACLMTAAGFYFTTSELFSITFLAVLVWMSFQWPTPRRLCVDLKLKGDEKDLILYKRDQLN
ncbi:MAG: hypothetical protein AB7K37_11265 [Cyclobacteriaceae bacterium]